MLEREAIAVRSVTTGSDDDRLVVFVTVHNPVNRTLYAYASPRRILYDNATGKLTICLHDQHVAEETIVSRHLPQPKIVPLEGGTDSEIKLSLPPVIRRIRNAAERGTGGVVEELHVSEATDITVEIAHQDTPFYFDPKQDNAKQLKKWGKAIARGTFKVKRPRRPPRKG